MHDELPPKMVKAQLVRLDDTLKQIERRQVAGIQRAQGSLPVLEAFQAFLENEQRKARRRMIAVTVVCLLLMGAVGATSYLLVRKQLSQASVDFADVSLRTDTLTDTVNELKRKQDAELLALENRFREESNQIVEQYSNLQKEQQALTDKIGTRNFETLEERLVRLEAKNKALQERLTSLTSAAIPTANGNSNLVATGLPVDMQTSEEVIASNDEAPIQLNAATNTIEPAVIIGESEPTPSVNVIEHPLVYLMMITPEGHTTGIRWMLPRLLNQE